MITSLHPPTHKCRKSTISPYLLGCSQPANPGWLVPQSLCISVLPSSDSCTSSDAFARLRQISQEAAEPNDGSSNIINIPCIRVRSPQSSQTLVWETTSLGDIQVVRQSQISGSLTEMWILYIPLMSCRKIWHDLAVHNLRSHSVGSFSRTPGYRSVKAKVFKQAKCFCRICRTSSNTLKHLALSIHKWWPPNHSKFSWSLNAVRNHISLGSHHLSTNPVDGFVGNAPGWWWVLSLLIIIIIHHWSRLTININHESSLKIIATTPWFADVLKQGSVMEDLVQD